MRKVYVFTDLENKAMSVYSSIEAMFIDKGDMMVENKCSRSKVNKWSCSLWKTLETEKFIVEKQVALSTTDVRNMKKIK
jgi:hypothetical protein